MLPDGLIQPFVGEEGVGVDGGTRRDVLGNLGVDGRLVGVGNDHRAHLAGRLPGATLKQAHDDAFAPATPANLAARLHVLVHVLGRPADERLVALNGPVQLLERAGLNGGADAMEHEPRGLLRDAEGAAKLVAADAVLGVQQQPDGGEPLAQLDGAVLEDAAHLDGELVVPVAIAADEQAAGFDLAHTLGVTPGARHPFGPAHPRHELMGAVGVGELLNALGQRLRKTLCHV